MLLPLALEERCLLPLALEERCKVLVAEDDAIQALGIEQSLEELGCDVLGPAATTKDALDLLREERPSLALLDMMLLDGISYPVADRLATAQVPFAMLTGMDPRLLNHASLQEAALLPKPCPKPQLQASVRQLFRLNLDRRLARTNQLIAQAWQNIERQVRIVNRLALSSHDTRLAEQLLQTFERTVAVLEGQRDLLMRELNWQESARG